MPLRTDNDRYEVSSTDVREWLVYAILEEDKKSFRIKDKIQQAQVGEKLVLALVVVVVLLLLYL